MEKKLEVTRENINENNTLCNRCKMREADFVCESCEPFRNFCANCDGYVHSTSSKRTHERDLIYKLRDKVDRDEFDNRESISTYHRTIKNENSYGSKYRNKRSNFSSIDYVNMKTIEDEHNQRSPFTRISPDYEKDRLLDNISALEKQLQDMQNVLNEKISSLQNQLDENSKKYNLNLKILNDEHVLECRKIINEKDVEIRELRNKNQELEKYNSNLNHELEKLNFKLNQTENEFKEYLNRNEIICKKREVDFEELKNFNENRIKLMTENFSQDKTQLINYFEKNIDKINSGYKESKEKYLNLLSQREHDIKEILHKMRLEENKYNEIINSLKTDLAKLREDNLNISNSNKNLKQEINTLVENLAKTRKDLKFFINQSKIFEAESKNLTQEKEEMKIKFDKLHRITHGKFKNANV